MQSAHAQKNPEISKVDRTFMLNAYIHNAIIVV